MLLDRLKWTTCLPFLALGNISLTACLCQHIPNICRHCVRILMYMHKCVLPDLDLLSSPTMVLFKESKQNRHPNAQSTFLLPCADVFLATTSGRALPSCQYLSCAFLPDAEEWTDSGPLTGCSSFPRCTAHWQGTHEAVLGKPYPIARSHYEKQLCGIEMDWKRGFD